MRQSFVLATALWAAAFSAGLCAAPQDVSPSLDRIRNSHEVPALAAAAIDEDDIVAIGVSGFRQAGGEEHVLLDDRWHLGSCTKSMTASVVAMLVEEGKLRWDSTIGEVLGQEVGAEMHPEWREVTVEQLLVHRGGAPHEASPDIWTVACGRLGTPTEQRLAFVRGLLVHPPEEPPGSRWIYSDSGYSIVGAMMERVTGQPWETLMRERLFEPLGMTSAGFGEPATAGVVDQPWGHRGYVAPFTPVPPGPDADNPPAIGPAATVHCSITDFARYARWHVAGARGEGWLLSPESFARLHTPPPEQQYAMGWAVTQRRWAGGTALMHNGENEMFYAVMWLGPGENTAFVAACNADGAMASDACNEAIRMLINRF